MLDQGTERTVEQLYQLRKVPYFSFVGDKSFRAVIQVKFGEGIQKEFIQSFYP